MEEDKIQIGCESIINGLAVPTFIIDLRHRLVCWNHACEKITGKSAVEMVGTDNHRRILYDQERPTMADLIVDGADAKTLRQHYGEKRLTRSSLLDGAYEAEDYFAHLGEDGLWLYFTAAPLRDAQGRMLGAIETLQDVSDRHLAEQTLLNYQKNLEKIIQLHTAQLAETQQQLVHAEKMASIGQLAAGVAHELNNPIGFVNSNLNTLETYLADLFAIADAYAQAELAYGMESPPFERARQLKEEKDYDFLRNDILALLHESKEGLSRVARIVRDLKDFSHAGNTAMQWADLHAGLESTLNIVWNELKYKCTVTKRYGELPPVWCDISQLNQVFMNLLVNAGHAIAEKGEITIATGREGDKVFVAISDTGSGIAPENLKRIFDPFFTTKPVGKGTGLGLSLAYGIVQKHRGNIEVKSELGKGSTFTVWLPIEPPTQTAETQTAVLPAPTLQQP
ncbi:ATP-binding protein [Sulfuricystis multivorans]|uniref:ATP-binding protein n=1 Tax=Sulfuricystis multivorans TaxID=2211108 RepID=UPI0015587FE5|nr:ATP-binding protein [Sulfuricystis multivorans]